MLDCDYCDNPASSSMTTKEWGSVCCDCYEQITGESFHKSSYEHRFGNGDLVIWIKDDRIVNAWCHDGHCTIPESVYGGFEDIREAIRFLKAERDESYIWCTSCGKKMKQGDETGSHFAGHYCSKCWKQYQNDHDRKCMRCGQPMWRCVC